MFPMKRPPNPSGFSLSAIKSQLPSIDFTYWSFVHLPFYGRPFSYPYSQARFASQRHRDGLNPALSSPLWAYLNPCGADFPYPSRHTLILRIYGLSNGPSRRLLLGPVDSSSTNPSPPIPGEGDCPFEVFFTDIIYFPSTTSNIGLFARRSDTICSNYGEFGEDLAQDLHLLDLWVGVLAEGSLFYSPVSLWNFWTQLLSSARYDLLMFFVSLLVLFTPILVWW